jgi:hypothetical protein
LQGWNGAVASRDAQALQARLAPGFRLRGRETWLSGGAAELGRAALLAPERLVLAAGELLAATSRVLLLRVAWGGSPALAVLVGEGETLRLGYLVERGAGR